jgi:hypothetical protein
MTGMMPDSGVPCADANNSLCNPDTVNCNELWYSTSRCQPRFDPAAANAVLSELINLVNCADLPYDCAVLDNLCRAVKKLIADMMAAGMTMTWAVPGVYSWVVPKDVKVVHAVVWGGGGSGGGHLLDATNPLCGHSGSGGGGGGFAKKTVKNLVPGTAITVTVGAGGVKVDGDNMGNTGGVSSFGTYVSATGGIGGDWGSGGPWHPNHAGKPGQVQINPAIGVGGDLNLAGGFGTKGDMCWTPDVAGHGGNGGGSPNGGGGGPGSTSTGWQGVRPGGGGAGAGGGTPYTTVSGNGAAGMVTIEWISMG